MRKSVCFTSSISLLAIVAAFIVLLLPIKAQAATCTATCRTGTMSCSGTTCYASDYGMCVSTGPGGSSKTCDQFDLENLGD